MNAGKQIAQDDVVRVAVDNALFVGVCSAGFNGCDKGRADIGKVSAHGLRGQDGVSGRDGAAQCNGAIKPLPNFLNQSKRALNASVSARTGGYGDQSIGSFFNGFVGVLVVDDVMQDHASIGMGCGIDVFTRTEAGDDDGHFVFDAHGHVML